MSRNRQYLVKNFLTGEDLLYGNIKLACKENHVFAYSSALDAMKSKKKILWRDEWCLKEVVTMRGIIKRVSNPAIKTKNL